MANDIATPSRPWVMEYQSLFNDAWLIRGTYRLKRQAVRAAEWMEQDGSYKTRVVKRHTKERTEK